MSSESPVAAAAAVVELSVFTANECFVFKVTALFAYTHFPCMTNK
jgi:hypothetical protein